MNTTRDHILDCAPKVFAERGYSGASTRVLAEVAGVNISTLAYHFGNKQGLYDAVVDQVYVALIERLSISISGDTPADRVRHLMAQLYPAAVAQRDGIRVLLRAVMTEGALPSHVTERWQTKAIERASAVLSMLDLPDGGDRRLTLLSINHLMARYAVSEPADILPFVDGDPHQAVAAHLGELAVKALNLE
jgi:AcrR family transcriptional regulator